MLNSSKRPKGTKPGRLTTELDTPVQDEFEYIKHRNVLIGHHKDLIAAVLPDDKSLEFPIDTHYLKRFLSGYTIEYLPFDNSGKPDVEGFWVRDPLDESRFTVFYNINASVKKQRYTQVHETFHIYQSLDPYFLAYADWLFTKFPEAAVRKMVERVTEKSAAMYLMPEGSFLNKYKETQDIPTLSDYFQASKEAVGYRIKELGLVMANR